MEIHRTKCSERAKSGQLQPCLLALLNGSFLDPGMCPSEHFSSLLF